MKKQVLLIFTIYMAATASYSQAPAITSFIPASGPAGTLVTITGSNLSSPTAFTIGGVAAIIVSNTGSSLVGMVMPGAVSGSVSITTAGGTATGSSAFTVTPTPFPSAQQGGKLTGSDAVNGTNGAYQGYSVGISADGNTAIVGGTQDNNDTGAAWIYIRTGNTWAQQGPKLVGTGAVGLPDQGSVALSADGNTAVVGASLDGSGGAGAIWIYKRTAGVWSQQGPKLVGTGTAGDAQMGLSVALSADGNTALAGGFYDNTGAGAAWVFARSGGAWTQQGSKLVGTGSAGPAQQGMCVSLSADGNTAIIGGINDNGSAGAAWVFTRSGTTWTQQGSKLVGTGATGPAEQGASVSLSADGNTAIVGGFLDNSDTGAVWVFTRSGGTWTQQGSKLVGTGNLGPAYIGNSVSLSADGNTAIAGGVGNNNDAGGVWVFTRSAGIWTQQPTILIGTGATGFYSSQGHAIALSADGSTAISGGKDDNNGIGAAWIFNSVATGIENISAPQELIKLYPNPNNGTFTLETSGLQGSVYQICDMPGQIIEEKAILSDQQSIDMRSAAPGIYTLIIKGKAGAERVVIQ